jgi:hypothetical protein
MIGNEELAKELHEASNFCEEGQNHLWKDISEETRLGLQMQANYLLGKFHIIPVNADALRPHCSRNATALLAECDRNATA